MSDEHQDWIQDKTDEDNTRDNLERLQEDGGETSLNTNDEPDDTKSLSSKSKGYTEEALEQIIGGIPVEAIGTMVWNNLSPSVKDVIKTKLSKEANLGIPFEDHIKGEATDEESEEASDTGVSPERDYGQKVNTPVPAGTTFNESDRKRIKDWHGNTGVEDEDGNVIEDRVLINSLDGESKATENEDDIVRWMTLWNDPEPTSTKLKEFLISKGYDESTIDKIFDQHGIIESLGESKATEDNPCWDGYTQYGMKEKDGKQVPNCVKESKANEEGIASVSGPADSSAIVGTGVHVKPEDDEEVDTTDPVLLNETYVEDQYGYIYRPVYVGESHKTKDTDLIYNGKLYTMESVGNCPMCKGAGKVTVERLGLKECPKCDGSGDIQGEQEQPPMIQQEPPMLQGGESCNCQKKTKDEIAYESFISKKIEILKKRAKGNESVTMMYGLPTIRKNGRKIKGTLAYAGVSLNDRIYLPEELAKGHGKTLPLLLNHSAVAGAENEMDRLDDEMRNALETESDYNVGEVTLTWDADKLTLYYEGVVENEFFQKEIDDMDMAVSLGIYYDSDSPKVCDEECYTLIKGAEFREVSLVYHAGFPIATIEAVEAKLKKKSSESITLGHYDEDEEKKSDEVEDELPLGGTIDAEPKDEIVESLYAPQEFSVRGVSGMTISNSNGVERYTFDPTHNYSTNTIHFDVLGEGATIFGEQLQPKMTTPEELTKEIEAKGDLEVEDSGKNIIAEL